MLLDLNNNTRLRVIEPSEEAKNKLGKYTKTHTIISKFAINPNSIERLIARKKAEIFQRIALMGKDEKKDFMAGEPIDFVEDKGKRKRFNINCVRCGEKVAYCWAFNEALEGWCDLHYICWYDRKSWHGAMALNVSPLDESLGFECACGEDTRDFRGNKNMPPIQKRLMIEYTMTHKEFGKKTSKFLAIQDTK